MKTLQIALLVVGLLTTCWSARVNLIFARSGSLHLLEKRNPALGLISILAIPAAISLLIGAFFALTWPWALGLVACALFLFGAAVTRNNLHFFASSQTVLDLVSVLSSSAFWYIALVMKV